MEDRGDVKGRRRRRRGRGRGGRLWRVARWKLCMVRDGRLVSKATSVFLSHMKSSHMIL